MEDSVAAVYSPSFRTRMSRPLIMWCVSAGFPSPAEDYVEGRIDLNRDLIKHPIATFYIRVAGDSMSGAGIDAGDILIVDRAAEASDGHVVVARINDELCVKQLCTGDDGRVCLLSANDRYAPIEIEEGMDFEIWGRVMWSLKQH